MKAKQQISVILPSDLTEIFQEEVNKRIGISNHERGHQTDIIKEALYKHFKLEEPPKIHPSKSPVKIEKYKKIGIEHIASALEKGGLYDFPTLKIITGLSRTTLRRIITDNPDWFEKVEHKGANGKDQFLMIKEVLRPSRATEKRKGKRRKAKARSKETKANVDKPFLWDEKRKPGELGEKEYEDFLIAMENEILTDDEATAYTFRYYEEDPESYFSYDKKDQKEFLALRDQAVKKFETYLRSKS